MAKAKVLDDKLVITSEVLTNENIEKVSILKPSVLILKDEEADKVLYETGIALDLIQPVLDIALKMEKQSQVYQLMLITKKLEKQK